MRRPAYRTRIAAKLTVRGVSGSEWCALKFGHLRAEPALECGSVLAALVRELARGLTFHGNVHRATSSKLVARSGKSGSTYRSPERGPTSPITAELRQSLAGRDLA